MPITIISPNYFHVFMKTYACITFWRLLHMWTLIITWVMESRWLATVQVLIRFRPAKSDRRGTITDDSLFIRSGQNRVGGLLCVVAYDRCHFPIGLTFPLFAFGTVRFSVKRFNVTRSTARTNPSLDSAGSHHCKK